jgi:hypothetical protein
MPSRPNWTPPSTILFQLEITAFWIYLNSYCGSSLPNALPVIQPAFTRMARVHCVRNLENQEFFSFSLVNFCVIFLFIYSYWGETESLGTAAITGLLYQPQIMEKLVEWSLAGETEVLGENLPQSHFCPSQNPTWLDPGLNSGRRGGKPATNRLSYGAAKFYVPDSYPLHLIFSPSLSLSLSLSLRASNG